MPGSSFRCLSLAALLAIGSFAAAADDLPPLKPIPRLLPPEGIEIPAEVQQRLEQRLETTKERLQRISQEHDKADAEIFTKAVELALLHHEFYSPKDFEKADWALDQANSRLDALEREQQPWRKEKGLVVRGYRSTIDDSAQPYGLVIPEDCDFRKPGPLYVWLHGRGDKNTDLHFLYERATKVGQIAPPGSIVVHAFGRHCVGFKHAGEEDLERILADVIFGYEIQDLAVVLIGFSMGGAGAWHLGAHHADYFVAVSPGAGFAETARYQNLTPDKYPPWYEQKLWGQYDVPNYVRNLFNTQVIAYSGENDKQIQAARVMEEAYRSEGRELTHLIGPGVEHKYEPKTLEELLQRLDAIAAKGMDRRPKRVFLQTRTLDYSQQHWVQLDGLEEHWEDARVEAEILSDRRLKITTKNVSALWLFPTPPMSAETVAEIDGQEVAMRSTQDVRRYEKALYKEDGRWKSGFLVRDRPRKHMRLHGPIDDAFKQSFVVVTPSGKSRNKRFQQWMEFELQHLRDRWRALMRAELPEQRDVDVSPKGVQGLSYGGPSLILWGDADSNSVIRELNDRLPAKFVGGKWRIGEAEYDGDRYVPVLIHPFPGSHSAYIVLNSGLTFREGHDRTNSLQNPKLPDWAVIDISQKPDAFSPGRIHDAGFFDEQWELKDLPKGP